ncbi:MAG: glycosyltransferase [Candidatus Micrarchaeia archaeon]
MVKKFCLILPVYNEIDNLHANLGKVYAEVKRLGGVLSIAEDGSTDGSKEFIKAFSKKHSIIFITAKEKLGRGRALKRALTHINAKVIGYTDADLSVSLRHIKEAVILVEKGNKIVIGSRYSSLKAKRSFKRLVASKVYNFIVKIALNSKLNDHQCGFKFWDSSLNGFIKSIKGDGWFFDTELLIKAQRRGIKIYELPVGFSDSKRTKVKITDIIYFLREIIRLRLELHRHA